LAGTAANHIAELMAQAPLKTRNTFL